MPNVASRFDEIDGTRTVVLYGRGTEPVAPFARVRFEPTASVARPIHDCDADAHFRVETNARVISAEWVRDCERVDRCAESASVARLSCATITSRSRLPAPA